MNHLQRCIEINRIIRSISLKTNDIIINFILFDGDSVSILSPYIVQDLLHLKNLWPPSLNNDLISDLENNLKNFDQNRYIQLRDTDLPKLGFDIDQYFLSLHYPSIGHEIETLLHPLIIESSYSQFKNGHFRDAVLNSIVAIFDLIRKRTEIDQDGSILIAEAFGLKNPKLIFSDLETESGKNEQKGFIQILQGVYQGIRNPKAHSLFSDLEELETIQYLIFSSVLIRRVEEAINV